MADAILYGIAQEVLKNLGSRALNEIASTWGFKDRLENLKITINTIKDVLLDAEEKQANSHAVRSWLARLTTAVYAADDLFDEFNTIASRKQFLSGNKVAKEVKTFFSDSNQIVFARKISRKMEVIRGELEDILDKGKTFNLAERALEQGSVITGRRDQTHSYVDAEEVIGRDDDKNAIVNLLLASDSTENEHQQEVLPVLPIVGIGGMGKTTLAQLIYNDPQVQNYFELRLWVCVAEDFDIKVITEMILRSATNTKTTKLDMDQLQSQLRKQVGGKKYLLVLDDVWEENPNKWEELRVLLKIGRKGSCILVTTRSRKVANTMGTFASHELQGLSEEKSWALFEKMAFKSGKAQQKPHLVKLGKEIVKKCANVPLAIKTLGGLLRSEDESKWWSFKDKNLVEVMDVLKLSYQHLLSPLKNCFAYCALFPKDYRFDKVMLIELWMAEGFIISDVNGGQSLEDVADDYFLNLLQRGFFQDVERNRWGEITSCKMHDLMHDLAQQVAKAKCKVAKFSQIDFEDTIIHLSFADRLPLSWEIPNEILNLKMLHTFLFTEGLFLGSFLTISTWQQIVTKFRHLRVLDLQNLKFKSLHSSIGKLIHLRYLNLYFSKLETLPNSITNLYNLQTLNLEYCTELKTLPKNIQKLANLRSLDISNCYNLTHLSSGIGGLTLLYKLPFFIVSHQQSVELRKKPTAKLSDLKKLNNLRGKLSIRIHSSSGDNISSQAMEADMTNKHGLIELNVLFDSETSSETNKKKHDEAVLEGLKPHYNLRYLSICEYGGEKLPSWAVMDNLGKILSNLVEISLKKCRNCQHVPSFSQLRFLKRLELEEMESVVYMESYVVYASPSSKSQDFENLFFPSLEELKLWNMKNLKGWWKEVIEATTSNDEAKGIGGSSYEIVGASRQQHHYHLLSLQFLKLSKLNIIGCPNLIFLPVCPNVEELTLREINKNLSSSFASTFAPSDIPSSSSSGRWSLKLKRLQINDVEDLISLSQLGLGQLSELYVIDTKLESTERLGEVFATLSSSLQCLEFWHCYNLRSISKGLEHLTALEELAFEACEELDTSSKEESEEDADAMMPWKAFNTSLHSLELQNLPKLVSLPSGIQSLTNLRQLMIVSAKELREVPEWISCLSSLQYLKLWRCPKLTYLPQGFQNLTSLNQLYIFGCPGLKERCQWPNGTDWPKIQHIQHVRID